jgi:hypothetical protein
MKLQHNTNTIVRSGSFEESNYTIEASAKAFSILSDGLYANKIEAVIRELSTNAYDAHVDAGHPEKCFDVHLPNRFEPSFSIRDYGTGLSHEDCMSLYTTYFGSNKTSSNDAVGCLGLGSKSPFAYTDSFIVTSYFNGKKRVYNSYKNERDEPVFALLNEEDSNAPVGMEISFAVEQEDVNEFEETAQSVYKFFKTLPMLVGKDSTELFVIEKEVEYIIEGSNWGLVKKPLSGNRTHYDYHNKEDNALAIMGQIAYPLDSSQFEDEDVQALLNSEAHIHFNIGELDITPSREALSYNEYTKRAIKETVECILLEMKEVIEESFDECETLHEARMKYYKLKDSGNILNRVVGIFDIADITWLDVPLWSGNMNRLAQVEIPESINVRSIFRDDWKVSILTQNTSKIRFDHTKDMHFIYDDLKRGGIGRAKHFIKSKVGDDKYSSNNNDMGYLFTGGATKDEVIDALQCDDSDLILTSTLPSPTNNRSYSSGGEVRSKLCVWKDRSWKDVDVDMSTGGYFVEINRYDIVDLKGERSSWINVNSVIGAIKDITGESEEEIVVYGIKSQELKKKKFNSEGQWTNLLELLSEVRNEKLEEAKEFMVSYCEFENSNTRGGSEHLEKASEFLEVVPNDIKEYLEERINMKSFKTVYDAVKRSSHWIDKNFKEEMGHEGLASLTEIDTWDVKWDKLVETYPMLIFIGDSRYWHDDEEVVEAKYKSVSDYIVLVNKSL